MISIELLYLGNGDNFCWPFGDKGKYVKGALNPYFLNLTINREKFGPGNVLVQFLNLLLLKSCKSTLPLTSIPSGVIAH